MARRRRAQPRKRSRRSSNTHTSRSTHEPTSAIGDITLSFYANLEAKKKNGGCQSGGRMKKENLSRAMESLTVMKENNEKAWDECDEEVSDAAQRGGGSGGDGGSEGVLRTTRDHKRRRRRVLEQPLEWNEEIDGVDYPLDLWFLISDYIRPEDVSSFASLCQATYYITTTTRFWLSMFRRHYQWSANVPDSLTYWNIDNTTKHLRVCVVRALFLMYAPFCVRVAAEKQLIGDPTKLLRAQCILQWHKKEGTKHKYFFKFICAGYSSGKNTSLCTNSNNPSTYYNPHSGCWVLEVTSGGMCAVPMVIGDYLYHAGLGVSANLCNHCLHLAFVPSPHLLPHSSNRPTRRHQVPATEISLEPVSNVLLYPWWHPHYWLVMEAE